MISRPAFVPADAQMMSDLRSISASRDALSNMELDIKIEQEVVSVIQRWRKSRLLSIRYRNAKNIKSMRSYRPPLTIKSVNTFLKTLGRRDNFAPLSPNDQRFCIARRYEEEVYHYDSARR